MLAALLLTDPCLAVSARYGFLQAYENGNGGDWLIDEDNEEAYLGWDQSYVMMSLATMVEATGDRALLSELARHIDGALANRDDARGVSDYRGVSTACWRNTSYQDGAYCYVVHSGMIGFPIAEAARIVALHGLEDEPDSDGRTFGEKATEWTTAAAEIVAAHDDQWRDDGYYIFREDASFLTYAGVDVPLNQSNAMGRLLLTMHALTGEVAYHDKAAALAARLKEQMSTGSDGALLWNYWGGTYSANGEDISHAAISADFVVRCAEHGVVFDDRDLAGLAATFTERIYVDDHTFSDYIGGSSTGTNTHLPQIGRWLRLSPTSATVYAAVHDLYADRYPAESIGSGSMLLSQALLGAYEPVRCAPFFYYVDWIDEDEGDDQSWRQALTGTANLLTIPPELDTSCLIPLEVEVLRAVQLRQWDGSAYHDTVRWQPGGGEQRRMLPYEPQWPYPYYKDGVLFQFYGEVGALEGIRVRESLGFTTPQITSSPPTQVDASDTLTYTPEAEAEGLQWWSISGPTEIQIDRQTGALSWQPPAPGSYEFALRLETDHGSDIQSFTLDVMPIASDSGAPDTAAPDSGERDSGGPDTAAPDSGGPDTAAHDPDDASCGCQDGAAAGLLLGLLGWRRRRRQ